MTGWMSTVELMEGETMVEPWWLDQEKPGRWLTEMETVEVDPKVEAKSQRDTVGREVHSDQRGDMGLSA